jgi:hypothetical protein
MGERARLPADQRALGIHGEPHCCSFRAYEWLRAMTSSRPTHSVSVDEVTLANSHASKQLETLRAQTEHRSGGAIAFSAFGPGLRPAFQPRPLHTYQVQYSGMIWFRAAVNLTRRFLLLTFRTRLLSELRAPTSKRSLGHIALTVITGTTAAGHSSVQCTRSRQLGDICRYPR